LAGYDVIGGLDLQGRTRVGVGRGRE
jgi:hypothetical protein